MNLKILKLGVLAAFLAFAGGGFLFSNARTQARSGKNRDAVLDKIAAYKNWKQVQKPPENSGGAAESEVVTIENSAAVGG